MTVIWILIALFIGAAIGFTACALLTVDKVKPRLPKTQLIEQAYKNGYKKGAKDFAERVKEEYEQESQFGYCHISVDGLFNEIDQIAKELEGPDQ